MKGLSATQWHKLYPRFKLTEDFDVIMDELKRNELNKQFRSQRKLFAVSLVYQCLGHVTTDKPKIDNL